MTRVLRVLKVLRVVKVLRVLKVPRVLRVVKVLRVLKVVEKGMFFFGKYLHILCFCSTFVAKILTMHIKIVMFSKVEVKVNVGPMYVLCKF